MAVVGFFFFFFFFLFVCFNADVDVMSFLYAAVTMYTTVMHFS